MYHDPLVDLPDDQYRAHWLAFHETIDWSKHEDVTAIPVTFDGPDALYRRNKGSFMEALQPAVHCRPYAGHARRARRTGAWIPEEKVFETSLIPAIDLRPVRRRLPIDVAGALRKLFVWPERANAEERLYGTDVHAATAASSRWASTP